MSKLCTSFPLLRFIIWEHSTDCCFATLDRGTGGHVFVFIVDDVPCVVTWNIVNTFDAYSGARSSVFFLRPLIPNLSFHGQRQTSRAVHIIYVFSYHVNNVGQSPETNVVIHSPVLAYCGRCTMTVEQQVTWKSSLPSVYVSGRCHFSWPWKHG